MKKYYLMMAGCLTAAAPAQAATYDASASKWYAGISGDFTWPNHADMGGGGNVDLGYRFAPGSMGNFRAEAEAGYHSAGGDDGFGDLRYFNYMGNMYYDFSTMQSWPGSGWRVAPYVGGGLGMASLRRGQGSFASTFHHHTNAFSYQGMTGLAFGSGDMPDTEWTVGYRYVGTERENGFKLQANNLELGFRYHF